MTCGLVLLAQIQQIQPNPQAPGAPDLAELLGSLMLYALLACAAAVLIGGALWRGGATAGNYAQAGKGRMFVSGGVLGAIVVGLTTWAVNTAFNIGQGFGS